jgi:hypothetical protein
MTTNDVEVIAKALSKMIHLHSLTPDFSIKNFDSSSQYDWNVREMDEPVKKIRDFLPNCRSSERIKKNLYYKAERIGQSLIAVEILGEYLRNRKQQLYYKSKLVVEIKMQWLTVKGHIVPKIRDFEKPIIPKIFNFPVTLLKLQDDDNPIYIDLCATQLDINTYDEKGHPYLILTKLEPNTYYSKEHNLYTKIVSIEEAFSFKDDTNWNEYLDEIEEEEDRNQVEYIYAQLEQFFNPQETTDTSSN